MVNLVKNITNIQNIFTYFEFEGYDGWNEFDYLLSILTNQIGCQIKEKLDGIYSRHCTLQKEGFTFKLMYHEDFGNCLCNQDKEEDEYYNHLEKIGREVVSELNT